MPDEPPTAHDRLTRREQDVLFRLLRGDGNEAIAARLYISLSTVETHVRAVLRKHACTDRVQLLARYLDLLVNEDGWVRANVVPRLVTMR